MHMTLFLSSTSLLAIFTMVSTLSTFTLRQGNHLVHFLGSKSPYQNHNHIFPQSPSKISPVCCLNEFDHPTDIYGFFFNMEDNCLVKILIDNRRKWFWRSFCCYQLICYGLERIPGLVNAYKVHMCLIFLLPKYWGQTMKVENTTIYQ